MILFCLGAPPIASTNPQGGRYAALKTLSNSAVMILVLFQQLRAWRASACLRDAARFFSHLFPGVVGLVPGKRVCSAQPHSLAMRGFRRRRQD
jgi:hypothetical protein